MHSISKSVTRKDHLEKATGRALYHADQPAAGVLTARLVRSAHPNARLRQIVPPTLPPGYFYADGRDVPRNETEVHDYDMPVFPTDAVRYVGEPLAIIAGPDAAVVDALVNSTQVYYADEKAAIVAPECSQEVFFSYAFDKGNPACAFHEADFLHTETLQTGLQEHVYLETQSLTASVEAGVMTLYGSMQCPYYIVGALKHAYEVPESRIRVVQHTTGGGFGGKEDVPSHMACQLMAVAQKAGLPCCLTFSREEDMAWTTKRNPARMTYTAAVKEGRVTALRVEVLMDAGAYKGLSGVVLQRTLFSSSGVYNIPNMEVSGKAIRTNTPSNGAFRGFGGPQAFFAVETFMRHLARRLGEDEIAFRVKHLAKQGDTTANSGVFHEHVPIPDMLRRVMDASCYAQKRAEYAADTGRFRRGIGLSMFFHGCGFSCNGEADFIKARVALEKDAAGNVRILGANAEIGQGVETTFAKIVAETLGIPLTRVHYPKPDTGIAPDSGPTVASRSLIIVGQLLARASKKLKAAWVDGMPQRVEERFIEPPHKIRFDPDTMRGDAYPSMSWGVNVVAVSVDTWTGVPRLLEVWADFDCGTPIDLNILRGQAEGGILQGIGYGSMERMVPNKEGVMRQQKLSDYIIPTALDAPPMHVTFYDDPYYDGPFGARGAGEMTLVGGAPAYVAAVENALGIAATDIPLTPERILETWEEAKHGHCVHPQ